MKLYQTDKYSNNRCTRISDLNLSNDYLKEDVTVYTDAGELYKLFVDETKTFQEWEGFGGAFTESAADVLNRMSPKNQKEMMDLYFHPVKGIGFNFCRTHINSCDFSLGNWSCCEEVDLELNSFSIEHYKKQIIPMINLAKDISEVEITFFSSPWSPPSWMKSNGEMNNGGKLKKEYMDSWALFYCKYIKAMAVEGITISAITIQNEPAAKQIWDSCIYSPEDERDFVKNFLGPKLEEEGLSHIKIVTWDHNRAEAFDRAQKMFDDKDSSKYVYGVGIHWYMGDNYQNLKLITECYKDKKIWFTEGCQEGGPHIGDWNVGERYAHSIINDLNFGTSAWCDWNLFLDEIGGPNHVGNYCSALILGDTTKDEIIINPSYYYFSHFSKFIKKGAKRVAVCTSSDNIEATGFLNPNGEIVVVICNNSEKQISYSFNNLGKGCYINMPSRSIQTLIL